MLVFSHWELMFVESNMVHRNQLGILYTPKTCYDCLHGGYPIVTDV